jgi:uncharacterized protein (TIGR00730 family)
VERAKRIVSDHQFLAGPRVRRSELRTVVNVAIEFLRGFRKLHFVGPCVTVFGSARTGETEPAYLAAREVAERLGRSGFSIMTGGGPGIMEAANRGAREVGAVSIGCTIDLPEEQASNPYLDLEIPFDHFFVRKVMLVKYSFGFVVMEGGFGTGDELFEALTLIQTGKIANFPVVLMGSEFWAGLLAEIDMMKVEGTIAAGDTDLLCVTDDPEVAARHIHRVGLERFGLSKHLRPLRLLGERGQR